MQKENAEYRSLNIVGFTLDATQPLALFKDETSETTLPLWLDMRDVLTITTDLMTNRFSGKGERSDLLDGLLSAMGLSVAEIWVDGHAGRGYSAKVSLSGSTGGVEVEVDLATALMAAIRFKLPVNISEEALSSSSFVDQRTGAPESSEENRLMELLAKLDPADMGKYPM